MEKTNRLLILTNDEKLKSVLEFCFDGWGYKVFFEDAAESDIAKITKISPAVIIVDIPSRDKSRLQICDALKKDYATAHTPVIPLIDKRHLRQDLLTLKTSVDDYLIKPPDPFDLKVRIEIALKRSQHSFYASPLTGLPGGIVIEETLRKKIENKETFIVGHADIDNFKTFNDKYGYLKGDRMIMQTAYMLSTAVRNLGNSDDFVGHIGGDDFVFITTPEKYRNICQEFICTFDTITPFHYSSKDRAQKYVVAKDRTNKTRRQPLSSITVALVLKNNSDEIATLIELNERIAEVKQYLKKMPGSKYMADRRVIKKDDHLTLQIFSNDKTLLDNYKPLGQILLDKSLVTAEQLDDALKAHWRRGAHLGEILKEQGLVSEEELSRALSFQESGLEFDEEQSERKNIKINTNRKGEKNAI